ncbi:MAG: PhoPQ-activated protein PqaA family protein, partial [Planctomycetota bacterium]
AIEMALDSGKIVSRLGMVPNQPIGFAPEFRGRIEDDLVAHTWNLYMETGDQGWLARWPMVKSAVRAMDTVEEFLASPPSAGFEDPLEVEGFIVTGASKRGWTTWLTGATDARVSAIVPVVTDVLNVIPSMDHHYAAYGFWAPAVRDYEEQGIMARKNEGIYRDLIRLVDPYYYRDQLQIPKYIVNSAGDQFFLPDSSQFYFDELPGENYLRYVPNTDHSLSNCDARESIAAYTSLVAAGAPRPKFSWSMEADGSIRVSTADQPTEVRLWQAVNPDARDFRLVTLGAAWSSRLLRSDGHGVYHVRVRLPEKGWIAFFVELTYTAAPGKKLKFTTAVRVLPNVLPYIEKLKVYRSRETP